MQKQKDQYAYFTELKYTALLTSFVETIAKLGEKNENEVETELKRLLCNMKAYSRFDRLSCRLFEDARLLKMPEESRIEDRSADLCRWV